MTTKKRITPAPENIPEWFRAEHQLNQETHDTVLELNTEYHTAHVALVERVNDMDICLYGKDRDDGIVTKVGQHDTTLRIMSIIFGIIGTASMGGVIWLIENAIKVASTLAATR
jgi:hypothetical protein